MMPRLLVDRTAAAAMLCISKRHFVEVVDPELARVYLGRCVRYDVRDIEALIERQKVPLRRVEARTR
jgi:hypothetical protein